LTEELSLSDEQRGQVESVLRDAAGKMVGLREEHGGGGGDREAARKQLRKIQRETESQLSEILDDQQMKRYKELAQERLERLKDQRRKGGHHPPGRG
jgi:hypothetical protein